MISAIRAVKVLKPLSDTDCAELVRFMRVRQYETGALIFERGKPGDTMLVVADGALSVVMQGPRRRNIEVARVGVGEVVGDTSCIDPAPRCTTILAATRATAYELGRKELTRMRKRDPGLAIALVGAIVHSVALRLRRVDERIDRELAGHLAARLPELRQTASPQVGPTGPGTWTALLARLRGSA
jgi:CRP/FNR family transcriptional regulator, cyclic AMP receptor protein